MASDTLNMGIIGHGFVGKAVDFGFSKEDDLIIINKYIVDPLQKTTIKTMFEQFIPDVVFIAVPTPMGDNGVIDSSIILSVFKELNESGHTPLAIIKSTITPEVIDKITSIYTKVVYNPEFLRERSANRDFIFAPMLIIGTEKKEYAQLVKQIYDKFSNCVKCPVHVVDLKAASLIKYTLNSFLASKVLFFNNIKKIFDGSGTNTDWKDFIDAVSNDERIGTSHMEVPGPDGRLGFGGACFPKDTAALAKYARSIGEPFIILEDTIKENQIIRSKYKDLDAREKEQNVKFNIL